MIVMLGFRDGMMMLGLGVGVGLIIYDGKISVGDGRLNDGEMVPIATASVVENINIAPITSNAVIVMYFTYGFIHSPQLLFTI